MGKIISKSFIIVLIFLCACTQKEDLKINESDSIRDARPIMMDFMEKKYGHKFISLTDEIKKNGLVETYHVTYEFPDSSCQFTATMIIGGEIWDDYNACVRIDEINHMFDDTLLGRSYVDTFEVRFDTIPKSSTVPYDSTQSLSEFLLENSYQIVLTVHFNDLPMNDDLVIRIHQILSEVINTDSRMHVEFKIAGESVYSATLVKGETLNQGRHTEEEISHDVYGYYRNGTFCKLINNWCLFPGDDGYE